MTIGASLTFVRFTVTVAVSVRPPASVTCTVSVKLGVVSKSSAAALATVIAPVVGLIAKAPPVLPAGDRVAARVAGIDVARRDGPDHACRSRCSRAPRSRWSLTTGASLTFVRLTVTVAVSGEAAGVRHLHRQREARRRLEVERRGVRDGDRARRSGRSRRRRRCCPR